MSTLSSSGFCCPTNRLRQHRLAHGEFQANEAMCWRHARPAGLSGNVRWQGRQECGEGHGTDCEEEIPSPCIVLCNCNDSLGLHLTVLRNPFAQEVPATLSARWGPLNTGCIV
eukprot:s2616_g1.t1